MAFDPVELKQRIQRQRAGLATDAGQGAQVNINTGNRAVVEPVGHRRARGERLYRIPVLGYWLRVIAAVVNFPHILANLERHYATVGGDRMRLEAQMAALRHDLSDAVTRLERAGPSDEIRASIERLRGAVLRLACAMPDVEPARRPGEDDVSPVRSLPQRESKSRALTVSARDGEAGAITRGGRPAISTSTATGAASLQLEQVADLTLETAIALSGLPSGSPVLDYGGVDRAGYGRALHVFGLQPRTPANDEIDLTSAPAGACGAVWVDPEPRLTLDSLERALAVMGARLPKNAVTVLRGGSVRFEPALARMIAEARGFRLDRMMSAGDGTALVLLRA